MEAVSAYETSFNSYQTTRLNIPEDSHAVLSSVRIMKWNSCSWINTKCRYNVRNAFSSRKTPLMYWKLNYFYSCLSEGAEVQLFFTISAHTDPGPHEACGRSGHVNLTPLIGWSSRQLPAGSLLNPALQWPYVNCLQYEFNVYVTDLYSVAYILNSLFLN
jgi:hypothetical protein